jgi:hypothetical protein
VEEAEGLIQTSGSDRFGADRFGRLGCEGGIVETKPRGLWLDTDAVQRRLRGDGDRPLAILWCKMGSKQQAFIIERFRPATD